MKRPRMSASDSDCSIDWLASDEEDNACEQGLECDRAQVMFTSAPAASDSCGSQVCTSTKENKDTSCSRSSSPSSSTSFFSSSESELSSSRQEDPTDYSRTSGSPKGKSRQALKRVRSMQASEQKDKHFTVNQTEKDKLFACKCMELQCYIHPLSLILNGLRSGRYRERLSTFQESVAMDRIQRIMGVLQNPYMGERYINIILKMEEMLKVWFPHIKPNHQASALDLTQDITLLKKPKLSSAPVSSAAPAINPGTICPAKAMRVSDLTPPAPYSATNLKWLHTSPICSHTAEQTHRTIQNYLTARRSEDVTQDNSVSSTIDTPEPKDSLPNQPPPGKISAPCLERLLKSTESIISHKTSMGNMGASTWS